MDEPVAIHGKAGEVTVTCPECKKQFIGPADGIRSNLKRHLLVHSGERPHQCDVCSADFTTSTNLKRHMRLVHGTEQEETRGGHAVVPQRKKHEDARLERKKDAPQTLCTCPDCEVTVSSSAKLKRHLTYHCPFREDITLGHEDDPGTPVTDGAPDFVSFLRHYPSGRPARKAPRYERQSGVSTVVEEDDDDDDDDDDDGHRRAALHRSLQSLYMCSTCSEVFKRRRLLKRHVERMHPTKEKAEERPPQEPA